MSPRPTQPPSPEVAAADAREHGRRPRRPTSPDGILLVDKPPGMTSHDVVSRLRGLCGTRAVGHGGTLDPLATGVLICGIGKGTKLLTHVSGCDKTYEATIRLGVATTTDDAEGGTTSAPGAAGVDEAAVLTAMEALTGEIQQVPATVSAIKVAGQRAHRLAREGQAVQLAARPVTVSEFRVDSLSRAEADGVSVIDIVATITVSAGTYIRALARDLGEALGTGGHLTRLRRTRVGVVGIGEAQTLEQLADEADAANSVGEPLGTIPLAEAAARFLPTRLVTPAEAADLGHGRYLAPSPAPGPHAALTADDVLVALIQNVPVKGGAAAKPTVVFHA